MHLLTFECRADKEQMGILNKMAIYNTMVIFCYST